MFVIQWSYTFAHRSGWNRILSGGTGDSPVPVGDPPTGTTLVSDLPTAPPRDGVDSPVPPGESPGGTGQWPVLPMTHARDFSTLGYFKNHCSLSRGSMGTSARWLKPTLFSYGFSSTSAPNSRSFSVATLRAAKRSRP